MAKVTKINENNVFMMLTAFALQFFKRYLKIKHSTLILHLKSNEIRVIMFCKDKI